jgi:hypothetical protein
MFPGNQSFLLVSSCSLCDLLILASFVDNYMDHVFDRRQPIKMGLFTPAFQLSEKQSGFQYQNKDTPLTFYKKKIKMTNSVPLYYIRFLKPPPTECLVGQHFTVVWTIESDLGDQSYWETIPVTMSLQGSTQLGLRELNSDPKGNSKKKAAAVVKPYMRQQLSKIGLSPDIPLVFDPLRGGGIVSKLVIEQLPGKPLPVGTSVSIQLSMMLAPTARSNPKSHSVWQNAYQFQSQIWLLPTWSAPISASVGKQRHLDVNESGDQAERMLQIGHKLVHIREDAVQSIARHVWYVHKKRKISIVEHLRTN